MGKNKSKLRKGAQKEAPLVQAPAAAKASSSYSTKQPVSFPLRFPSGLKYPQKAFLRNHPPYEHSFQQALTTSYEGFVIDEPEQLPIEHETVERALQVMEEAGFFRVDITQPFGLGTKLAKTYVTRCLVGEAGTTYKYLGLRMFAHPWKTRGEDEIQQALATVANLNGTLTERIKHHLSELDKKRQARGDAPTRGRTGFDVALINRMESPEGLKDEPTTGEGKCSVSWHADSSLEHYSTIAVYHLLSKKKNNDKWSVGLRVAHNSEGPGASRRGTDISVVDQTPPLAVSLPSRSTYYLLDDFNHHHQHAVLAEGKVPGRRFSSTHRLLRESHNVTHMLARCKACCTGFHKKGPKVWRSEQLLLTEMESEWLRQFFIQGKVHHRLLWHAWEEPINNLLKYWTQLEERTKQTIEWLQLGAEGECGLDMTSSAEGPAPARSVRKLRERRKKAREGIQELLTRGDVQGGALKNLYEPFAVLLEERATMRELWLKREKDGVFHEVDRDNRPMPLPCDFAEAGNGTRPVDRGWSPLDGDPTGLGDLADSLRGWGKAYESGNTGDLPTVIAPKTQKTPASEHRQSHDWIEWGVHDFALEMQDPWAGFLLNGTKSIETRAYNLPPGLLGRRIHILQSCKGKAGVSSLGDVLNLGDGVVQRVGWCRFKEVIEYRDQATFEADEEKHMVKSNSGYGWRKGKTEVVYGWVVDECGLFEQGDGSYHSATRRLRSLFELHQAGVTRDSKRQAPIASNHLTSRKRKKRRKKK